MTYHEYQDAVSALTDKWELNKISDMDYYDQLAELKAELAKSAK